VALAVATATAGALAGCGSAAQPAHSTTTTTANTITATTAATTAPVPVAQLVALARRSLPGLGDSTVTYASVVTTTKQAAENWLEPGSVPAGASNPRAYLVVLSGRFVCESCTRPSGASAPRGSSAQFVWVPGVGLSDFGLTPRVPPGLRHLGRVLKIYLPRIPPHVIPPPPIRPSPRMPVRAHPMTPSRVSPADPSHVVTVAPSHVAAPSTPSGSVPVPPLADGSPVN